jgi:hypothetical protein
MWPCECGRLIPAGDPHGPAADGGGGRCAQIRPLNFTPGGGRARFGWWCFATCEGVSGAEVSSLIPVWMPVGRYVTNDVET